MKKKLRILIFKILSGILQTLTWNSRFESIESHSSFSLGIDRLPPFLLASIVKYYPGNWAENTPTLRDFWLKTNLVPPSSLYLNKHHPLSSPQFAGNECVIFQWREQVIFKTLFVRMLHGREGEGGMRALHSLTIPTSRVPILRYQRATMSFQHRWGRRMGTGSLQWFSGQPAIPMGAVLVS